MILSLSFLLSGLKKLDLEELELKDDPEAEIEVVDDDFVGEAGRERDSLMSRSMCSRLGLPGIPRGADRFVGDGVRVRCPFDEVVLRALLGLTGEGGSSKASGYSKVRLRRVEGVTGVGKIDVDGTWRCGVESAS